jgi:hypothetical protein
MSNEIKEDMNKCMNEFQEYPNDGLNETKEIM